MVPRVLISGGSFVSPLYFVILVATSNGVGIVMWLPVAGQKLNMCVVKADPEGGCGISAEQTTPQSRGLSLLLKLKELPGVLNAWLWAFDGLAMSVG
jgi:hypothetical protein